MRVRAKLIIDLETDFEGELANELLARSLVEQELRNIGFDVNGIEAVRLCGRCGSKSIAEQTDNGDVYCKRCWKAVTDPKTPF